MDGNSVMCQYVHCPFSVLSFRSSTYAIINLILILIHNFELGAFVTLYASLNMDNDLYICLDYNLLIIHLMKHGYGYGHGHRTRHGH